MRHFPFINRSFSNISLYSFDTPSSMDYANRNACQINVKTSEEQKEVTLAEYLVKDVITFSVNGIKPWNLDIAQQVATIGWWRICRKCWVRNEIGLECVQFRSFAMVSDRCILWLTFSTEIPHFSIKEDSVKKLLISLHRPMACVMPLLVYDCTHSGE